MRHVFDIINELVFLGVTAYLLRVIHTGRKR